MKHTNAKVDLMDAFWILYQKKNVEKISVRELCELAGYNRTTFYVYFKDIYDLLEQFIGENVFPEELGIGVMDVLSDHSLVQNIMCYLFKRNNRYLEVILKNHHGYILQEIIVARIKKVLGDGGTQEFTYVVRYQISAILGVLEFWYQQGEERISEQQLVTLVYEASTKGVLSAMMQSTRS